MFRLRGSSPANGRRLAGAATRALLTTLLLVLALLNPACGTKTAAPVEFDQGTIDQLENALQDALEKDNIPGAIVGVWVPGRGEWVTAEGMADRETGEGIEVTDLMRIGSVTKSFAATLVLELVDEGLIGLDGPLADYFPWVQNAQDITVRMLLNHTSGIVDDYGNPAFMDIAGADPLYKWKPEELARASLGIDPAAVRGETYNYANTNYVLLGMIVEQVSGLELADAMEKYVFEPLGLTHSFFPDGPGFEGEHSHSYITAGENGELYDMTSGIDPSITWAAGAIISTVEDLKMWAEALATGELVAEATHEEQLQWVEVPGMEGAGIGYQYGLGILKLGNFVGHNGEFSAFQTTMFYLPSQQATVVVLLNSNVNPTGSQDLFTHIAAILFPDEVPEGW